MVTGAYDIRYYPAWMPRRLVWSEVRDLLDVAACVDVDELMMALRAYQADPPMPNEPVDDG